jgi:hypothetical protein
VVVHAQLLLHSMLFRCNSVDNFLQNAGCGIALLPQHCFSAKKLLYLYGTAARRRSASQLLGLTRQLVGLTSHGCQLAMD